MNQIKHIDTQTQRSRHEFQRMSTWFHGSVMDSTVGYQE